MLKHDYMNNDNLPSFLLPLFLCAILRCFFLPFLLPLGCPYLHSLVLTLKRDSAFESSKMESFDFLLVIICLSALIFY